MGTTAAGIPYPEPADDVNTYPATAKTAAQKVPDIQVGTIAVVLTNAASGTVVLTYPRAFAHTPRVVFVSAAQNYFAFISTLPTTTAPERARLSTEQSCVSDLSEPVPK